MENNKEEKKVKVEAKEPAFVTSIKTADFPSFNWSIQAGETKQLPAGKEAQEEILSKYFITINK